MPARARCPGARRGVRAAARGGRQKAPRSGSLGRTLASSGLGILLAPFLLECDDFLAHAEEDVDEPRIEVPAALLPDVLEGILGFPGRAAPANRGGRIENLGYGREARRRGK